MTKVDRYIRKRYAKADRYWSFERVVNSLEPSYSVVSGTFVCPICGNLNYREDWDKVDEFYPRCLHCRNIVVEDDSDE